MERTKPGYQVLLEQELAKWETFKYALRGNNGDKQAFEDLINSARCFIDAGNAAVRPLPMETIFMTMLLV